MKLMIASDIHGSAFYCEQMLEAYRREEAERLLLLGDILYHGPRNDLPEGYAPKEVIAMLNPMKDELLCVRGNCDTEVDQMVLHFPIMADYCFLDLCGRKGNGGGQSDSVRHPRAHLQSASSSAHAGGRYSAERAYACSCLR